MANIEKILIVGPAWIGDMIMSQALFKLLKQLYPQVHIDVLAPEWTQALLERMPEVSNAINMPLGHGQLQLKQRWQLGKQLRAQNYDHAIVLPNSWKSAIIPYAAQIPRRTGWIGEMRYGLLNDTRRLNKKKLPLMVERFLALSSIHENKKIDWQSYKPSLEVSITTLTAALNKFNLSATSKPILAICPGAEYGPAKRWPAEYFAEVAKQKIKEGWQVWIFGSEKDQAIAKTIQQLTQNICHDLTGKTTLAEAIDLLSLANLVLTNDSGLMHIAAALQRSMIVLYGSTSPQFTPPLTNDVKILSLNLACSPCFKRECPLGHLKCLKDLTPEMVLNVMEAMASNKI